MEGFYHDKAKGLLAFCFVIHVTTSLGFGKNARIVGFSLD